MIILNDYRITPDGSKLIVDVIANPALTGVYLTSLEISCDGTFTDKYKSNFDNLIALAINSYTGDIINWEDCPTEIHIELPLNKSPYVFGDQVFYLKVTAVDPLDSATCKNKDTLHACTFNKYPLYNTIACAAKEFDGCEPPMHFIDYLLRLKAMEASIAIGDATSINRYYHWLILRGSDNFHPGSRVHHSPHKGCGCHK